MKINGDNMTQRSLKPYREAQLTPLMKWAMIVGIIVLTIIINLVMPVVTFA